MSERSSVYARIESTSKVIKTTDKIRESPNNKRPNLHRLKNSNNIETDVQNKTIDAIEKPSGDPQLEITTNNNIIKHPANYADDKLLKGDVISMLEDAASLLQGRATNSLNDNDSDSSTASDDEDIPVEIDSETLTHSVPLDTNNIIDTKPWRNINIFDAILIIIGIVSIILSIIFVLLVSDFVILMISGHSLFLRGNDAKIVSHYDFWSSKSAILISIFIIPLLVVVYTLSIAVSKLEIENLCLEVLNIKSKRADPIDNYNFIPIDQTFNNTESSSSSTFRRKKEILNDVSRLEALTDSVGELNDTKSVELLPITNQEIDNMRFLDIIRVNILYRNRFLLGFLLYIFSVFLGWVMIKLICFEIYGTMTISDVRTSFRMYKMEWVGLVDLYIFIYNIIALPILYIVSHQITSNIISSILMQLCDTLTI